MTNKLRSIIFYIDVTLKSFEISLACDNDVYTLYIHVVMNSGLYRFSETVPEKLEVQVLIF